MRVHVIPAIALMLAVLGAAAAQDAPRRTGPGDALPGPNATPPQAQDHPADAGNAVQPVPGAMPGSDTVPSTISEKNAADDKLITTAYTFKNLTDEQRGTIFQALKDKPAGGAFNAQIGTELPSSVELQAVPDEVVRQVPQTGGYQYAVADNRVLLVSPPTRIVVAAFPDAKDVTTGASRRTPNP
jgi:Protein of unknown function (DUF1236)